MSTQPNITSFKETELTDQSFTDYDCYATHDNGGRPFIIQVRKDKKHIQVFEATFTKQARKETSEWMVNQEIELDNGTTISRKGMYYRDPIIEREAYFCALIKEFDSNETPFEIYIGVDTTKEEYGYDGANYPGASVLLRFPQSGNECFYFGTRITKFTIVEPIVALYCPIGNNDVVYPYLMTDSKCYNIEECESGRIHSIEKEKVEKKPPKEDIYNFFYSTSNEWTKVESSFVSERVIDKNYYRDPTVSLISF